MSGSYHVVANYIHTQGAVGDCTASNGTGGRGESARRRFVFVLPAPILFHWRSNFTHYGTPAGAGDRLDGRGRLEGEPEGATAKEGCTEP